MIAPITGSISEKQLSTSRWRLGDLSKSPNCLLPSARRAIRTKEFSKFGREDPAHTGSSMMVSGRRMQELAMHQRAARAYTDQTHFSRGMLLSIQKTNKYN